MQMELTSVVAAERRRILSENSRRLREIAADRHAPWQPAEMLMIEERKRTAARMLREAGVFPNVNAQCLEVGCGNRGWLADLITWGVAETNLHGIDIDPTRVAQVKQLLPAAHSQIADVAALPWDEARFDLVVASTVFTSVLDQRVRHIMAAEITRVLKPGGALLWYDFAQNNPHNPHVRKVSRRELKKLFPQLEPHIRSVTLAPPLARIVATTSWTIAVLLSAIPVLRTHLLGVLIKR
jgi:ubiquinone/menaquinone biosynthesis C-methylase UbiE